MTNFRQIIEDPVPRFSMFDNISIQSMMISFSNPGGRHFPKMTHLTTYLFFRSVSLRAKVPIPSNLPAASTTFLFLNKCRCSHTFWQRVLCNVNGNAFQPETYLNWFGPWNHKDLRKRSSRALKRTEKPSWWKFWPQAQGCETSGLAEAADCCAGMSFCKVMARHPRPF